MTVLAGYTNATTAQTEACNPLRGKADVSTVVLATGTVDSGSFVVGGTNGSVEFRLVVIRQSDLSVIAISDKITPATTGLATVAFPSPFQVTEGELLRNYVLADNFCSIGKNEDLSVSRREWNAAVSDMDDIPVSEPSTSGTTEPGHMGVFLEGNTGGLEPTITNINTTNEVTPGVTATLTGTSLTNATGLNIGSVSQADFTVVNDTTVTFTGTRGGNPYNQDLTATLLSPDGDATITVQQVPEAGTFAVTAASPNTTDDASLWANTVDTATGDPVTVVNGDQFWVNSTIPGLAIDPTGAITANETGTFTGQFWRSSEGVWGSDQTVSFTLPEEDDPEPPAFGRRLKKALNLTLKNSLRTDI